MKDKRLQIGKFIATCLALLIVSNFWVSCTMFKGNQQAPAEIYSVSTRQIAPPPVYNPVRWVRPGQISADRNLTVKKKTTMILPHIHYKVEDVTYSQAALILAGTAAYKSYVPSTLQEKRISLEMIGDIEEIANEISLKENIKVIVDHRTRSVSCLLYTSPSPRDATLSRMPSSA